ncbi:MAG TPA: Holliday junction branch migration DNA helicase RuvB [Candidatus Peribacterales bacterium]|nr:Holliday junction branch migration DNA helicase RuvB [Candidatus Peribacterales bacterium]
MAIKHAPRKQQTIQAETAPVDSDVFEQALRPKRLMEYVGQEKIKEHLLVYMQAARERKEPLGHVILHGPPGLGKTTLAHIVAGEMGSQIRLTTGPAIEKPGDLASILTNLQEGDVLFIDEIHRLRPAIEEVLYSAMEDCVLDIMIGKGPSARSMRIDLKPFTLIGATTKIGSVSSPLRNRFAHTFKLNFYNEEEMTRIVERSATLLGASIEPKAARRIASSSRSTPRIANRILRSIRDFAQTNGELAINIARTESTLRSLDIDPLGLDAVDRLILRTIIEKFAGGPVGVSTLAAATAEEEQTLEDVYEPYLLQIGFLKRSPQGRITLPAAYEHLGLTVPEQVQKAMFV